MTPEQAHAEPGGATHSIDALLRDLTHPRAGTRVRVARALIRRPDPLALELLLGALHDNEARVRREVIRALGKLGQVATAPLSELLRSDDLQMRTRAAEALGLTGEPAAATALLEAMLEPDQPQLLLNDIAKAVARIGDRAVVPICAIFNDSRSIARANATELLIKIAGENPGPSLRAALPVLRRRLNNSSECLLLRPRLRNAVAAIEAATASTRDLPLAAEAPGVDPRRLPIPSEIRHR